MKLTLLLLLCAMVLGACASHAQPSSANSISFQGALNAGNGQPLPNGVYTLVFQFWDHPTSRATTNCVGSAVTVSNVMVSSGVASTAIPVQPEWFNGQTRYLGITVQGVNNGQELQPRLLITTVPYAVSAQNIGSKAFWVTNGYVQPDGATNHLDVFNIQGRVAMPEALFIGSGRNGENNGLVLWGPAQPTNSSSAQVLEWQFVNGGRSTIRCYRGAWGTYMQFLTNDENAGGVDPRIRMHINHNGRVGIGTTDPQTTLDVNGTTRTTVLQITSARTAKDGFAPVDPAALLAKVVTLPISTWAYTNSPNVRHLGPVAEDFHAAFGLGDSDRHIATVDADGVALAAIQGLHELVGEKEAEIARLRNDLTSTQRSLQGLEARLGFLESRQTIAFIESRNPRDSATPSVSIAPDPYRESAPANRAATPTIPFE